eukprot:6294607-Prymnesium_polylepis.1
MGEGLGHAPAEAPRLWRGLQRAQPAGRRRQRGGDAMKRLYFRPRARWPGQGLGSWEPALE